MQQIAISFKTDSEILKLNNQKLFWSKKKKKTILNFKTNNFLKLQP